MLKNRRDRRMRPGLDGLEDRKLLSTVMVALIQGGHIGTNAVQGSHIGTNAIQGSHIGTNAIQGGHVGTNFVPSRYMPLNPQPLPP